MNTQSSAFAGQVALLTGAAGHLAATTALLLAQRGARIVAIDRPGADFSIVKRKLNADNLLVLEADARDSGTIKQRVDQAVAWGGQIDMFFNAAGLSGPVRPISDYPDEAFDLVIDVNVKGVFYGMKHVLRGMVARRKGVIVNACSLAAFRGSRGLCAYSASKHAVAALTKTAANENAGFGIRVVAIAPGPIESPMVDQHLSQNDAILADAKSATAAAIPQKRLGTADEVAKLVAFLCSDEASYINGSIVQIDGALGAG